jgi:hypothetical protein
MQEMLTAQGKTNQETRIITPESTLVKKPPAPVKQIKHKASLADITHKLFSLWTTTATPSKPPLEVDTKKPCDTRPKYSPRSCSSRTSSESDSDQESTTESIDEEGQEWEEQDDTINFAQLVRTSQVDLDSNSNRHRAEEWVLSYRNTSSSYEPFDWQEKAGIRSPPSRRAARPTPLVLSRRISETTDDLPTAMPDLTPTIRKPLRHAQSVPSIRSRSGSGSDVPPLPPRLLRKTTSTASLKHPLSPQLTIESESEGSLYREETDDRTMHQVVKLPSPERESTTARGRRTDVRQVFGSQHTPTRPAPRRPTYKRAATFSNFVASQATARTDRTLSAKQSLQKLLDQNPDKTKVLPFNVGLVLPAGGFRRRNSTSSDGRTSPIPTIRVSLCD